MAKEKKELGAMKKMENGKPKIFILHGWTYTLDKWVNFAKDLELKGFKIKLLKIPGLTEKINKPWNIEDYNNWLYKKLENEKNVILVGHSNGGRIAMAFSLIYPKKVKKLILIDSTGIYHDELYITLKRRLFGVIAKTGRKLSKFNFAKDFLYMLVGERDYREASENMKKTMVNLLGFDRNLKAENISVPTVIIWGKKDGITPVSDGKILSEKIVNCKLYIIDDARHSPQFTRPQQVIDIILKEL